MTTISIPFHGEGTGAFAMFTALLRRDPETGAPDGPVAGPQPLELARMPFDPSAPTGVPVTA